MNYDGSFERSLAVRCQNITGDSIYDVGPSYIMYSQDNTDICNIDKDDVLLAPDTPGVDDAGVEDPKIVYWQKTGYYYMFYTAVSITEDASRNSKLSLATSPSGIPNSWTKHGPLWGKNGKNSTGGSVVLNGNNVVGMIWGDGSLYWSYSDDMIHWTNETKPWLSPRKNFFDSEFIYPGPPPIKLSDGNYLFLYNSARKFNQTTEKPDYDLQYNVGFLILNGKDPKRIRYRSKSPIMSPKLPFEKCIDGGGQTPNAVSITGIHKNEAKDSFTVYYSACNSGTYKAQITVYRKFKTA
ncbi:hypothetical protein PCE1_001630 [Barthelona sp. PCE]